MGIGQSVDDAPPGGMCPCLQFFCAPRTEVAQPRYFQQKVKLGQGGFGTVWRAVDKKTNHFVAVKQIDKLQSYWQGAKRSEIQLEIDILRACDHENVTKLYTYFEDSQNISIAPSSVASMSVLSSGVVLKLQKSQGSGVL